MPPKPLETPYANADSADERTRLFDIVVAANTSETVDELATRCFDSLTHMLPLQLGFLLLISTLRPVLVHPRPMPLELERALQTLPLPSLTLENLCEPNAHVALQELVQPLVAQHTTALPLTVPLRAGPLTVGVMVLAGDAHAEGARAWHALAARETFLQQVGNHIGVAVKRFHDHAQLDERQQELMSFLNVGEDGYWQTDGEGRITLVNDAALRTLKRSRPEVMGKRIDELSDADPEGLQRLRAALRREGKVTDFILHVRASDGVVHTIRETMRVSRDLHGNPKGIDGIFRDISAELELQHKQEHSNHELQLLHELATTLNNTLNKQDMLDAGLGLILSLTRADAIAVMLIYQTEGYYAMAAHRGVEPELVQAYNQMPFNRAIYEPGFDPNLTRNIIEYVVLTRRSMTLDELRAIPRFDFQPILTFGYQSLLAFPIVFDTTVYGVVLAGWKKATEYEPRMLQVVESISAQLGLALRNQQLYLESQSQLREARALMQTGRMIQYAPTAEEGLPQVILEIRQTLNASYVVLQLLRVDHFQIVVASARRETRSTFPIAPYEQALLETDEPVIVTDIARGPIAPDHRKILEDLGMRAVVGVRLFAHGSTLGILFVNQEKPRVWTVGDVELIQRFAQQIAYALENKRLLDEINRQVRELHSLARAGHLIGGALAPEDALPAVAAEIARVLPADYVGFHLREGEALRLIAESQETGAPRVLPIQQPQRQVLDELATTRVSHRNRDAVHPIQVEWLAKFGLVADLGVPLLSGNKALGILYISQRGEHAWTDDEVQLAQTYATQITGALVNARLLRESQGQVKELRALARSAQLISSSRSPDTALPEAAAELRRVLGADYVGFHFVDGDSLRAITEFQSIWSGYKYPIQAYHAGVLDHFQKIVVQDRDRDARDEVQRAGMEQHGMRASVGVPLVSRGLALGILFVSQLKPREWQPAELRLIETYAQQIAGVVDNVRLLNERTERLHGLTQLATFNEIVVTVPDEASITELALTVGKDLVNADVVSLALIQDGEFLPAKNSTGTQFTPRAPVLTDWLRKILDGKVPIAHDAENAFAYDADMQERLDFYQVRASLWVPMVTAQDAIGMLCFSFRQEHVFTKEEKSMAQTVANQLAMAFANARLVGAQAAQIQELTENSNFSLWCGTIHESRNLQKLAIERICKILRVAAGSIRLVEGEDLTGGVCYGFKHPELRDARVPLSMNLRQVVTRQQAYPINDIRNTPDIHPAWVKTHLDEGFNALLMVPMIAQARVVGITTLYHNDIHSWTTAEQQAAMTLTNILALALSNTQQTERAEQKTDELQATLDSVFSGVFVTNAAGEIILWNNQAQEITGVSEAEMLYKHWDVDGPRVGSERRADQLVLEAMVENKMRFSVAPRYWTHPNGRQVLLRLVATPLYDHGGKVRGAVVAFWDRNEEQEGERAKVDFIHEVAHELGNKLGPLIWASEQMLNTKLTQARRQQYKKLIDSWLETLQVLDSRFKALQEEHVREEIEVGEFNLLKLVQERIDVLKAAKTKNRFDVRGDFDFVKADRYRLVTVLENLLNNAVKFATPGSRITIRARCPSPGELELTIHNRGIPIPPEVQPDVFARGVRGDTSQPGHGLGLWLVRTKLYEMGGDIRFVSNARAGTTFFVTLRRSEHALPKTDENFGRQGGAGNAKRREHEAG